MLALNDYKRTLEQLKYEHREKLYDGYAKSFKGGIEVFDKEAANRWSPCLQYYLRCWLPLDRGEEIIDLGCGDGRIIYLLGALGYTNVEGVDLSESQIKIAEQISDNVVKAEVLAYLRDHPKKYDCILAFDLIEHLSKSEALDFLDLCQSRLNTGGRLILQTPNASSPFFGDVRYGDFTHETCFTPRLLSQLLVRAGFSETEVRETGPVARGYSAASTIRYFIWSIIRKLLSLYQIIETGGAGEKIYTRVFLVSAVLENGREKDVEET